MDWVGPLHFMVVCVGVGSSLSALRSTPHKFMKWIWVAASFTYQSTHPNSILNQFNINFIHEIKENWWVELIGLHFVCSMIDFFCFLLFGGAPAAGSGHNPPKKKKEINQFTNSISLLCRNEDKKIIWLIFPWGRPAGKFKSNLSFSLRGPLVHRQIKLSFTNSNLKVFIYSPSLILVSVLTVNTVIILFYSINWFHEFNQSMKQKRNLI